MSNPKSANTQFAKAGMSILKRLVFDESTLPPDNRRGEERNSVAGEVEVVMMNEFGESTGTVRVFVRDVSKSGCGLWSRVGIPAGSSVLVKFPSVNGQPPVGKMAKVRHCRGQKGTGFAIGLRFAATNPDA